MSAPDEETKPTNPEEENQEPECTKPGDRVFLTLFLLSLCVLGATCITTVGGKWVAVPKPDTPGRLEYSIWKRCVCVDFDVHTCTDVKNYFRTAQALSVATVILQFLSVSLQAIVYSRYAKAKHGAFRGASLGLGALAIILLIVTVGLVGGSYTKTFCGSKFSDSTKMSWAFAFRVIEVVLQVIAVILFAGSGEAARNKHRIALSFAVLAFSLTVVSTASTGWFASEGGTFSTGNVVGLFQQCTCQVANDFGCRWETRKFRVMEAFSILALFVQFGFMICQAFNVPRAVLAIFAWTVASFLVVVSGVFTGWYNTSACDIKPIPERTMDLHFNYALSWCAFIGQFVIGTVATTAACGLF
jgi:hypothetical protein